MKPLTTYQRVLCATYAAAIVTLYFSLCVWSPT